MRFHVHKRRAAPTVIIVALIDVLVVLVIFLMVTTTFRQQPALKLTLPESTQSKKSGAEEHPPLVVSIDAQGNFRFDRDNLPVTLDQLRSRVIARANQEPDLKLAIRADKNAPWHRVVDVMDLAKEAKVKTLSAFTKTAGKP